MSLIEQLELVYARDIEPIVEKAEAVQLNSSADYVEAGQVCREIKRFVTFVESKIKEATEPIIKEHKEALRAGEALTGPLEEALDVLLGKIRAYEEVHTTDVKLEGITERDSYKFEIEDASKIPAKFLTPDTKMIGEMVRSTKGGIGIPGVRIWKETTKVIRGA